jgi:uncharacterized protein (DUF736 family)
MKKIGCFRQDGQNFSGNITTLQFSVQARLIPNEQKAGINAPDYLLVQTKAGGYHPEIGGAWKRVKPEDKTPYLQVEIDDPSCTRPILATLWKAEDGMWYLFWNRHAISEQDAESFYVQDELKPPVGWHRPVQKITTYLQELYPDLVVS